MTKRLLTPLLLAACAAASVGATAGGQKGREPHPCEEFGSQAEATGCAHREYQAADAELNRVYKQLVAKVDAEEREFLKKAETAWIKYRDAECEFEDSFYAGGTIRPMINYFCMARVTKARTAELRLQLKNLEDR